ncbi:MAG: GDP-mannose 4,6-dehydratase [Candidatus Paceibacterota bacterium]
MKQLSFVDKNILITGGAGFVGSNLARFLIKERPARIIIVDNFFLGKKENVEPLKKEFPALEVVEHDAQDYDFMAALLEKFNIDIVYNLATQTLLHSFDDPESTFLVNVELCAVLLKLLRHGKFKTLIHFSSSEVYGSQEKGKISEKHYFGSKTPYAAGKAAADLMIRSYLNIFPNLDIAVVRPFNMYGPFQNEGLYAGVVPITIKKILQKEKPVLQGTGSQSRDFIFVEDAVNAALEIYKNPKTRAREINIASGQETKIKDLIAAICKELGYKGKIIKKPQRPGDVMRHCADISLAKKLIGFKPKTSLAQGLKKTIKYYKEIL